MSQFYLQMICHLIHYNIGLNQTTSHKDMKKRNPMRASDCHKDRDKKLFNKLHQTHQTNMQK